MLRRTRRDPVKEQFWRQTLRDWIDSGKSRAEFCRVRKLSANTFDFWRRELAKRDRHQTPDRSNASGQPKPILLPVKIVSGLPLQITLGNGTAIAVPAGFDREHLRAVLQVLEDRSC